MPRLSHVNVAVIQAAPVLFDREASIEKACRLIREAAAEGSQVILLPEAFVPAYPRGLSFGMVVGSRSQTGRQLWQRYWSNAVSVPSSATDRLGQTARRTGTHVAIGIVERDTLALLGIALP